MYNQFRLLFFRCKRKIVAKDLRGEELKAKVQELLGFLIIKHFKNI
jgi:hypothetical protein